MNFDSTALSLAVLKRLSVKLIAIIRISLGAVGVTSVCITGVVVLILTNDQAWHRFRQIFSRGEEQRRALDDLTPPTTELPDQRDMPAAQTPPAAVAAAPAHDVVPEPATVKRSTPALKLRKRHVKSRATLSPITGEPAKLAEEPTHSEDLVTTGISSQPEPPRPNHGNRMSLGLPSPPLRGSTYACWRPSKDGSPNCQWITLEATPDARAAWNGAPLGSPARPWVLRKLLNHESSTSREFLCTLDLNFDVSGFRRGIIPNNCSEYRIN